MSAAGEGGTLGTTYWGTEGVEAVVGSDNGEVLSSATRGFIGRSCGQIDPDWPPNLEPSQCRYYKNAC